MKTQWKMSPSNTVIISSHPTADRWGGPCTTALYLVPHLVLVFPFAFPKTVYRKHVWLVYIRQALKRLLGILRVWILIFYVKYLMMYGSTFTMTLAQHWYRITLTMRGWSGVSRTAVGESSCHIFTIVSSKQRGYVY